MFYANVSTMSNTNAVALENIAVWSENKLKKENNNSASIMTISIGAEDLMANSQNTDQEKIVRRSWMTTSTIKLFGVVAIKVKLF